MRSRLLILVAVLTLGLTAAVAVGCGDDDDDDGGTATSGEDLGLINEGELFVGIDTPYPPFEIGQVPNVSGYDVEVLEAMAEELGLSITYQDTGFETIFRDVANGQFDTAAAASSIKPGRENAVDFTDPYYLTAGALLVEEGSDITSVEDLSGAIVGAQDATTLEEYANEQTDAAEVRGFPEGPDAPAALATGQVEAVIIDLPVAADAAEKQGGLAIVEEIPLDEYFGFAVAPDNDALREALNEALATIKEDGTLDELYQKYFGVEAPPEVLEGKNELLTND